MTNANMRIMQIHNFECNMNMILDHLEFISISGDKTSPK